MSPETITINHLVARHWKRTALITFACVALALLATFVWPKKYQSEMKFLVNNERADLTITPGLSQSPTTPTEVSETQVNSEMELLRSHDILRAVVLSKRLYTPYQRDRAFDPDRTSMERASQTLEKALSVSALRKTNIIDVTYDASDPDTAVAVLKDVSDRYLAAHLRAHSALGTDQFFSEQVKKYGDELTQMDNQLVAFRKENQLFAMPVQQTQLVTHYEDVLSQLRQVEAQVHVQEARLSEETAQMAGMPERVTTQIKQVSDPYALQQLEPILTQLENRRVELITKFKPTDRLVLELDQQIANTGREIAEVRSSRMEENTTDLNTLHQNLVGTSTQTAVDLKGLRQQERGLEQILNDYGRQLSDLDRANVTLQRLEQQRKEAEDNYELYEHHLGEARLSSALDRDKFSNVVLIETPVTSSIPITPKPALNLVAGVVLGLMMSVTMAFLIETRKITLHRPPATSGARTSLIPNTPTPAVSGD